MTIVQKDNFIENEMPIGDLPEGWESTSLKTVATLRKGKKPYKVDKTTWPGAVPYIDIEAFEKGNIRRYADQKSSALVNEGDIIVVWDGARCGHVGKTPERGALGSTLGTIQPILIHPDYILRFLQLSYESINTNPRGIGIPHVEPELFWNLEIPLAPLAEQKRIVTKVEKLLKRVNTTKERLAKVSMILKRFRQAVLAAACSGRLTADWREANPSSTNYTEEELPLGWQTASVGEVIESLKYGTSQKCSYEKLGVPVLRIPNIEQGVVTHSDLKYAELQEREFQQLRLQSGDILMIRSNGSVSLVGKSALIREIDKGFAYAGYLIRLRPDFSKIIPDFLNLVIGSHDVRIQIEVPARSTSGVHNINSKEVRSLQFFLPPLDEQQEIMRRVEAMFKLADAVEKRVASATTRAEKLTQAILAKAFRGELVPTEAELARREGRSYESASELLARNKSDKEMNEISVKLHYKLDHKKRSK